MIRSFGNSLTDFSARLQAASHRLLDFILPGRCLNCGAMTQDARSLCPDCWKKIEFLGDPCCATCGYPFEFDLGPEMLCAACVLSRPVYGKARAIFSYDEHSARPILALKHGDRTDVVPAFAQWMRRGGHALIEKADFLVPVPLHWTRLFHRRYNQAALLAQAISRISHKSVLPQALLRRRRTQSQGHKSRRQRQENIRNAFAVNAKFSHQIQNSHLLLIDDVMTTGATVTACAKTLKRAGAAEVDVLTLARIVRPGQMP